jgi:hypothetical protein
MLCGLGDGAISRTLLKQFCGLNNQAFYEVHMAGMSVDTHVSVDDYNYGDYPDAPITLVLGQADYTLPVAVLGGNVASFLRLKGVYFLVNGQKQYLYNGTNEERTTTNGIPSSFTVNGKSLFLNCPISAEALALYGTVHVEFQRSPVAFEYDDTTVIPGFMETYHDLIPLKASSLYLLPTNPNLANQYEQRFQLRLKDYKRDLVLLNGTVEQVITSECVNPV